MSSTEKHLFQAEIQQLLDIVIHSLYTDREVFLRELISNAADACERLRFIQTSGQGTVYEAEKPLAISVTTDEKAGTLTVGDTGVGMSHGELRENLGTVAHSGTKAFLRALAESRKPDANLIGQFGVGFYSAFMVAKKVTVLSRTYAEGEPGWRWVSEGAGGYELESASELPRGTQVILELKDDAREFAKPGVLERIIRRYSNFVQFPIALNGQPVNKLPAIWARQKSEVKEEEYKEFYHFIGHDPADPLYRLHFTADAPLSIQALLYVPSVNFEWLSLSRGDSEVHLYCRKVLIEPHAKGLFPDWLRFLRGVVDSEDLPLNVSRERMQDSALLRKLNRALTGRFLKFLEEQAGKDAATYDRFHAQYHRFLCEGVLGDEDHRGALGRLLRFESSATEKGKRTSLAEYRARMPEEQKEIYHMVGPTREAAESSPYFEVLRARKYEVLFLQDPIEEFVLERLVEFEGRIFTSAEKAQLSVEAPAEGEERLNDEDRRALAAWVKEILGARVEEVRLSRRLVESPAVVLERDKHLTATMRQALRMMSRGEEKVPEPKRDLELNPAHPVVVRLAALRGTDPVLAGKVAEQLFDQARMAAGDLGEPSAMLKRMNELLERVVAAPPKA